MLRQTECERYRQWKKEQDLLTGQKSKVKKNGKKRKEITDCLEEEKKEVKPKTVLKIRYHKCQVKEKPKPKRTPLFKSKAVSSAELILRRIQPPIWVRNPFLAQRHAECYLEPSPDEIEETAIRETAVLKAVQKVPKPAAKRKRKRSKRRKKDKAEAATSPEGKEKRPVEEEVATDQETTDQETTDQEETENEGDAEDTTDMEEEPNAKAEEGETNEGKSEEKGEKGKVKRKSKGKFWCKKLKKIEPEPKDSECDSICSFDSDICLKGLALTAREKKKIKLNRRRVRTAPASETSLSRKKKKP